mmetsp:Transcript_10760/g.21595  ORF Transcript_10760/g.21595 Transcript_10760/m.21595 type:complete len:126 (-) Transcript_10760:3269-3646(-)
MAESGNESGGEGCGSSGQLGLGEIPTCKNCASVCHNPQLTWYEDSGSTFCSCECYWTWQFVGTSRGKWNKVDARKLREGRVVWEGQVERIRDERRVLLSRTGLDPATFVEASNAMFVYHRDIGFS